MPDSSAENCILTDTLEKANVATIKRYCLSEVKEEKKMNQLTGFQDSETVLCHNGSHIALRLLKLNQGEQVHALWTWKLCCEFGFAIYDTLGGIC